MVRGLLQVALHNVIQRNLTAGDRGLLGRLHASRMPQKLYSTQETEIQHSRGRQYGDSSPHFGLEARCMGSGETHAVPSTASYSICLSHVWSTDPVWAKSALAISIQKSITTCRTFARFMRGLKTDVDQGPTATSVPYIDYLNGAGVDKHPQLGGLQGEQDARRAERCARSGRPTVNLMDWGWEKRPHKKATTLPGRLSL